MTTSQGPFEPDVFFVLTYDDGSERRSRAMAVSDEGISVLWRRSDGGRGARP